MLRVSEVPSAVGYREARLDAYLQIAEEILKIERRPLSPRAILAAAYRRGIVPTHLFGKTQHKTLGARISEDILERRDKSAFFRTAPGRFFVRELLDDATLPGEYRQPIVARRRVRDLVRGLALAIDLRDLKKIATVNTAISPEIIYNLLRSNCYLYDDPRKRSRHSVFLWSFVAVRRGRDVLSYRLGRYRDDRDSFMFHRSIGFSALVEDNERTLFNMMDYGIIDAGIRATMTDLDIPQTTATGTEGARDASLAHFLWVSQGSGANDLLAVIDFQCPTWFEPVRRRLSLNDLRWLDSRHPINDAEDFDPWSRSVLREHFCMNVDCGS